MKDYFMARGEEVLTRIVLEHYDKRYVVETPYSDSNLLDDLLDLTYAVLLAAGYQKETINDSLVELAKARGYKRDEEEN
jgi:hypothetical protein